MKQYLAISKVDEELRMVWGYASSESVDSQGETVTRAAMEGAWDAYMKFANIREMHQPWAAGVVKEYTFDDHGVFIGVKVVDDAAWEKVKEGVYKGFSIGGRKLPGGYDPVTKTISALELTEISLVDRPANPDALIETFKLYSTENATMTDPERIAAQLAKSGMTVEQLEALVAAQVPAVTEPVAKSNDEATPAEPAPVVTPTEPVAKAADPVAEVVPPAVPALVPGAVAMQAMFKGMSTPDGFAKCLYDVSCFSDLIASLGWLTRSVAYEAEYEGDGSALPAKLAAAVKVLGGLLVEMAAEEIGELVASLGMAADSDPITLLTAVVELADKGGEIGKANTARDVLKAGARNSAADQERIQKAHDALRDCGAECATDDETTKVNKAAGVADSDTISKALASFEKLTGELGTLRKAHDDLVSKHDELQKKFDKTPTAPKGALMAVTKGNDVGGEDSLTTVAPILKADGSVDEAATAIKAVHAGGGRPVFRR